MGRKVKLDFTNVEAYKKCEEGIHTAKLVAIDEKTTQAGDDMLAATFEVTKGDSSGARVFDNFTLTSKALWKLKLFLTAANIKAEGKIAIELDKLIGKVVDIEVAHEEYNGQTRARIISYTKVASAATDDDEDDDDDEDEIVEEAPKKKPAEKKPVEKKPEPKPDDDDDWEDDEDWEDA